MPERLTPEDLERWEECDPAPVLVAAIAEVRASWAERDALRAAAREMLSLPFIRNLCGYEEEVVDRLRALTREETPDAK